MSEHGSKPTAPEGFLLLTIPNVTITSTSSAYPIPLPNTNKFLTGLLSLECITISIEHPMERDVWLVLRVEPSSKAGGESFELAVPSEQKFILSRVKNQYTLPMTTGGASGELVITFPQTTTNAQKEDLETLEVILAQYAVVEAEGGVAGSFAASDIPPYTTSSSMTTSSEKGLPAASPLSASPPNIQAIPELKGRLVLVDEDNGQVLGALDDEFIIREDTGLRSRGHEKDPVVVEILEDEILDLGPALGAGEKKKAKREIFVHTIDVDDADWVSRSAGFLGRGIVFATNAISTGITHGTNFYINHSTPSPKPMQFSDTTQRNFKRVHTISGTAVKVSSKTTSLIHRAVEGLADKVAGKKDSHQPQQVRQAYAPMHPPQGPAQNYGIGTGLGATAAIGVPYGHGAYSPAPHASQDGSMQWTAPYPGSTPTLGAHDPPPYASTSSFASAPSGMGTSGTPGGPPPLPPRKKLLNRLLLSTDMLLTTLESSAKHLITHTTNSAGVAAGHKYGSDAESAVTMMGDTVKNVGVVYIDVTGVSRRALLKVAGKRVLKARLGGRDVVFDGQDVGKGVVKPDGTASTPLAPSPQHYQRSYEPSPSFTVPVQSVPYAAYTPRTPKSPPPPGPPPPGCTLPRNPDIKYD